MNSENEKLRALLQQALDMLEEQALHIEAEMQPASKKLLNQIRAALSQQAEPAQAQDERDAVYRDAELYGIGFMVDGVRVHPRRVTVQCSAARTAQNEQKPGLRHTDQWESARVADYNAGWNDRHTAEFSRLTDDQIFDIAEPFGEFRYGDAQGDRRLAFARAIIAATAASPIARTAPVDALDHVSEGAEMLQNLIDNIESKGNYSAESTVLFLNQALGCIRAALPTAPTP